MNGVEAVNIQHAPKICDWLEIFGSSHGKMAKYVTMKQTRRCMKKNVLFIQQTQGGARGWVAQEAQVFL